MQRLQWTNSCDMLLTEFDPTKSAGINPDILHHPIPESCCNLSELNNKPGIGPRDPHTPIPGLLYLPTY